MPGRKPPKADASLPPVPNPVDSFQKTPKGPGRKSAPPAPSLPPPQPEAPKADKPKAKPHRRGGVSKRQGKREEGRGRPPLLDEKVQAHIIESVAELGMSEGRAAMVAGVTPSAVSQWKQRGRRSSESWDKLTPEEQAVETRYVHFFKALRDAEPYFERSNLETIRNAGRTDWRAAKARLELRFPLRYGKRVMLGGDPENKTPVQTAITAPTADLSDQEIKARAERILKASTATARATGKKAPPAR